MQTNKDNQDDVEFDERSVLPLALEDLREAVILDVESGNASAALVILYNEFQRLLGEEGRLWRSNRYVRKDLFY